MMIRPENERTENKTTLKEWRGAVISLAAFATAHGGTVRFGISPDGRRVGVTLGHNTLENLANDIKLHTAPPLFPSIAIEGEESEAVVLVRTDESAVKPVRAFGKSYKRVGRSNQVLSHEEAHRLVELATGHTWDASPCAGLWTEHLSRPAIDDYLRLSGQPVDTSTEHVLENLQFRLYDGQLCNAAALLFADVPGRFITGAHVLCRLFLGDLGMHVLDEQILDAPLMVTLANALDFVTRHTTLGLRPTEHPQQEEMAAYPAGVVREAIINALIHRDYSSGTSALVCVYPARLEIVNSATLPYDITVKGLYERHPSRPRNRKVAAALLRAKLISQWGIGTMRMQEQCEAWGSRVPTFELSTGSMRVTLHARSGSKHLRG